ncbi:MAG: sugar phosphate isomerase/epimerase, partial [Caldilineae bacterium]
IVDLVARAGLQGIEWGGDVHAPHGDVAQARRVRQLTVDAGLEVVTYGSYYRVGHSETGPFGAVLESALALGAPTIRVWAGRRGSRDADDAYWAQVVEDAQSIADQARRAGVQIAFEYHGNTLTDTRESARRLLLAVDRPNVGSFWQPPLDASRAENLLGIDAVAPWLRHVHVFSWRRTPGGRERLPLAALEEDWRVYLGRVRALPSDRYALLEFVRNDDPEQFLADATCLARLVKVSG